MQQDGDAVADAQHRMAGMYEKGWYEKGQKKGPQKCIARSWSKAYKLYRLAADNGCAAAEFKIGNLYMGRGSKKLAAAAVLVEDQLTGRRFIRRAVSYCASFCSFYFFVRSSAVDVRETCVGLCVNV